MPPPALFHDDRELDLEALELGLRALLALPVPPRSVWMTGASRLMVVVATVLDEEVLTSAADRLREVPAVSVELFWPLMGLRAGDEAVLLVAAAAGAEGCFRLPFLPPPPPVLDACGVDADAADFLVLVLAEEPLALRRVVLVSLMDGSLLLGVDFLLLPDEGGCCCCCF